jgi:hypothetical protein
VPGLSFALPEPCALPVSRESTPTSAWACGEPLQRLTDRVSRSPTPRSHRSASLGPKRLPRPRVEQHPAHVEPRPRTRPVMRPNSRNLWHRLAGCATRTRLTPRRRAFGTVPPRGTGKSVPILTGVRTDDSLRSEGSLPERARGAFRRGGRREGAQHGGGAAAYGESALKRTIEARDEWPASIPRAAPVAPRRPRPQSRR